MDSDNQLMVSDSSNWKDTKFPQLMLKLFKKDLALDHIDRKLRLFACSCVRGVNDLLADERSKHAIEIAESYADGLVTSIELDYAGSMSSQAVRDIYRSRGIAETQTIFSESFHLSESGFQHFGELSLGMRTWRAAKAANYLTARRLGNHHTKLVLEKGGWVAAVASALNAHKALITREELIQIAEEAQRSNNLSNFFIDPWQSNRMRCIFFNPFETLKFESRWLTQTVIEAAKDIYNCRLFDKVSILGNELQEAGCYNNLILDHCYDAEQHDLGCWVVDMIIELSKQQQKA